MLVEIWADIVCPWCGLGSNRLDLAVAEFAHRDDVEIVHRSFQLDPSVPVDQVTPVGEMLAAKFGMSEAQARENTARIESLAEVDGLVPYRVFDNRSGNTLLVHELLAYATANGKHDEAWHAMYRAYFGDVRNIFDVEVLLDIADEIGLDRDDARDALVSHRHLDAVQRDIADASQLGVRGVPFVVVDRKYAVSGAQPLEVFSDVLEQAWAEGHPEPTLIMTEGAADGTCDPDGCAVPGAVGAEPTPGI